MNLNAATGATFRVVLITVKSWKLSRVSPRDSKLRFSERAISRCRNCFHFMVPNPVQKAPGAKRIHFINYLNTLEPQETVIRFADGKLPQNEKF